MVKPDINRLDMLMLKNRLDQWKKEVRLQGYTPIIYVNYRTKWFVLWRNWEGGENMTFYCGWIRLVIGMLLVCVSLTLQRDAYPQLYPQRSGIPCDLLSCKCWFWFQCVTIWYWLGCDGKSALRFESVMLHGENLQGFFWEYSFDAKCRLAAIRWWDGFSCFMYLLKQRLKYLAAPSIPPVHLLLS